MNGIKKANDNMKEEIMSGMKEMKENIDNLMRMTDEKI